MLSKVLENCQPPRLIGAAIADKNRLLDACHSCVPDGAIPSRMEQYSNGLATFATASPAALPCPWWRRTRRVTLCFRQTCSKPRFLDYILPKQFCEYRVRCQTRDETDADREEDGPLCVVRDGCSGDQLRICRQLRDHE